MFIKWTTHAAEFRKKEICKMRKQKPNTETLQGNCFQGTRKRDEHACSTNKTYILARTQLCLSLSSV